MLSIHEICATDGFNNGIFNSNNSSEVMIEDAIDEVVKDHNTSFLPMNNNFIPERNQEIDYIRPSMNQMRRQKKIRIMSNRHRIIKHLKKTNNKTRLCSSMVHMNHTRIPAYKFCRSAEQDESLVLVKKDLT